MYLRMVFPGKINCYAGQHCTQETKEKLEGIISVQNG
jgi:hypothetical protein